MIDRMKRLIRPPDQRTWMSDAIPPILNNPVHPVNPVENKPRGGLRVSGLYSTEL
jgi:hypothetical protein